MPVELKITNQPVSQKKHGMMRWGNACVVPGDLWHRQFAPQAVELLKSPDAARISWADDPGKLG